MAGMGWKAREGWGCQGSSSPGGEWFLNRLEGRGVESSLSPPMYERVHMQQKNSGLHQKNKKVFWMENMFA